MQDAIAKERTKGKEKRRVWKGWVGRMSTGSVLTPMHRGHLALVPFKHPQRPRNLPGHSTTRATARLPRTEPCRCIQANANVRQHNKTAAARLIGVISFPTHPPTALGATGHPIGVPEHVDGEGPACMDSIVTHPKSQSCTVPSPAPVTM